MILQLICSVGAADIETANSFGSHLAWDNAAGDLPIAGDWNADGLTDTGVYRPGVGFYLKMDNSSTWNPATDVYLAWDNAPGDLPIAGDWNADGLTDTGVYRPGVGFYLKMDNSSTWNPATDMHLAWDNAAGDLPIAGDWNADGLTDTGVYRPGVGFYLKMDNSSTWNPATDVYLAWDNAAGDLPIAGDWNADGLTDTGVYRPGVGFYLKMDNSSTWNPATDVYLAWDNAAGDLPIAGDWNADGLTDTGVYRPGIGFYLKMDNTIASTPIAAFTSDVRNGTAPLLIIFEDQSTGRGPLTYAWDFTNDGVIDSTIQSPSFTYLIAGTYSVNLTVTDASSSNTTIKTSYIIVGPAPVIPAAAFTASEQTGTAPLTVIFTDQSSGTSPLTYAWDFTNDGVNDSTTRNPSFTYTTAGSYTVKLTVMNAAGMNEVIMTGYITVTEDSVVPTAAFTSNKQTGTVPLTVTFTDQSSGTAPLTYVWDFNNDGVNDSTTRNPSFTYTTAGTYTVRHIATNAAGSDAEIKTGYITVNPVIAPTTAFISDKQAGTAPLTVKFTDQSTGTSPVTYTWDFTNDGVNDSTARNPSFTYTTAGTYTVRHTATNVVGSDAEIKTDYISVSPAPIAPIAEFTSDIQSGTAPLTVKFTDQSTGTTPLSYAWNFKNDETVDSTVPSPTYTYTVPGTYPVKLTVTNVAGNDSELKTGYIIVTELPVAPVASFIANKHLGNAPLTVRFTDQSSGTSPLSYEWDFNHDGIVDSTIRSPSFIYDNPGIYSVSLTVTNPLGSDSELKTSYILVNPTIAPYAAFTSDIQAGDAPLTVRFADQSTGTIPMIYGWDFNNDGTLDSATQNPSFTYTTAGTYTVKLTVTNEAGSDVRTEPQYITVTTAPPSSRAGVAITFDDNYVDQWYASRSILQKYNAHVTFFVSNFADLDQNQINKLKTLEADGNEIAFHGYNHEDTVAYLQSHTLDEYMNDEIYRGVDLMKSNGLNPVDFAIPFGSDDPAADQALEGYFTHVRDTYYDWDETIYYQYGSNKNFIAGIGMDDTTYGNSITDFYNGISRAKTEEKILIIYGHELVANNPGSYQTSYARLENILKYVSDNDLKTFTISEIN